MKFSDFLNENAQEINYKKLTKKLNAIEFSIGEDEATYKFKTDHADWLSDEDILIRGSLEFKGFMKKGKTSDIFNSGKQIKDKNLERLKYEITEVLRDFKLKVSNFQINEIEVEGKSGADAGAFKHIELIVMIK